MPYLGMDSKCLNANTLTITPETLALIAGIDEFKGVCTKLERERLIVAQLPDLSVRILDFARNHRRGPAQGCRGAR